MAAFSTLAMIGIAAGAGVFTGRKAGGKVKPEEPATLAAPGPTAATTLNAPPPLRMDRTDIAGRGRALLAANKQKRKALAGGQRPMKPGGVMAKAQGMLAPQTLIGGGY